MNNQTQRRDKSMGSKDTLPSFDEMAKQSQPSDTLPSFDDLPVAPWVPDWAKDRPQKALTLPAPLPLMLDTIGERSRAKLRDTD
jgi:hypothetical protein